MSVVYSSGFTMALLRRYAAWVWVLVAMLGCFNVEAEDIPVVSSPGEQGQATGATPNSQAEHLRQVLAVYVVERNAKAYAKRMRSILPGEVRVEPASKPYQRLTLGPYVDRSELNSVTAKLDAGGVRYFANWDSKQRGYAIRLGIFSDANHAAKLRRKIERLGIRQLQVTPIIRQVYHVVSYSPLSPLPATIASKKAIPPRLTQQQPSPETLPTEFHEEVRLVQKKFLSRKLAERYAAQLRGVGREVKIITTSEDRQLYTLKLRNYPTWTMAQQAVQNLRSKGLGAVVTPGRHERGFSVSIGKANNEGVYGDKTHLQQQYQRLIDLGYRNIAVVPVSTTVTSYQVKAISIPPEQAPDISGVAQAPLISPENMATEEDQEDDILLFAQAGMPGDISDVGDVLFAGEIETFSAGMDELLVEAGWPHQLDTVDASYYIRGLASAVYRPNTNVEVRLGARIEGTYQSGAERTDEASIDYGETFLRWRGKHFSATAGAQKVLWGRLDGDAPTDRLSAQDFTRGPLDGLVDRRRAVPAVRFEGFTDSLKLDLVWLPKFRIAELPDGASLWSLYNQTTGRILGLESSPLSRELVTHGSFEDQDTGDSAWGIRLSKLGKSFDYALTVQRTPHAAPYFTLNSQVRENLTMGMDVSTALASATGPTFLGIHPLTWVGGGDLGIAIGATTWRLEVAFLSDVPVTRTDYSVDTVPAIDWGAGVEFYPGDGDTRVVTQITGYQLLETENILDLDKEYQLNGDLETVFGRDRWHLSLSYVIGLNNHELYVSPKIAYSGWTRNEIYLSYHAFSGEELTVGGFYQNNDMVIFGWQAHL